MAKHLEHSELSAFCDGVAMMLAAGIQTDEAVQLLVENMEPSRYKDVCDGMFLKLAGGMPLSDAMEDSGGFPSYAISMVRTGEQSGRLENVLRSLSAYYAEEDRLFEKIRSAVLYPTALLAVMTIILAFTVAVILPVFVDVYTNISGTLTGGAYAYVKVSMGIGYVALVLMAICTVLALIASIMSRGSGRTRLLRILEALPVTRVPLANMARSRFTAALATYVAAGIGADQSLEGAIAMVEHKQLRARALAVHRDMVDPVHPKGLSQAIYDNNLFDAVYSRMMLVGGRTGAIENTLQSISETFFDDAVAAMDRVIDAIEPALAGVLTVAVGATLISVMLPLIGIMSSIG